MRGLLRLAILAALAVWAWRYLVRSREPHERASLSFSDGSAIVLEPGSAGVRAARGHRRARRS